MLVFPYAKIEGIWLEDLPGKLTRGEKTYKHYFTHK